MPVIRIDEDVYATLQRSGRAFEDTPNDVLRRLLQLDPPRGAAEPKFQEAPVMTASVLGTTSAPAPSIMPPRRRTQEAAFRRPILDALAGLGGHARVRDVLTHVESCVKAILTPMDRELLGNGEVRWENTAKWERKRMIGDGLLRADSPHGIWELTSHGRETKHP